MPSPATSEHRGQHGPAWLVQAAEISRQFFLEGRSKVDIGDDVGLSRFKVARILDEARELGLVQVAIRLPALIDAGASAAVRQHLGVRRAIVVSAEAPRGQVRAEIGRLTADLLVELVGPDDVLGMTCSRTITATSRAITELAPCDVVQLTGTLAGVPSESGSPESGSESGSVESVRHAAAVGGGRAWPIYAPMLLPDAATARALQGQDAIRHTLERAATVTVALVSIGGWEEGQSTVWESATARERSVAGRAGAVGEIGGRLYDTAGEPVTTSVDRRVLGVRLEQLRATAEVVAVAYGERRAVAVRAAVRGGLCHTLVCDHALASRLVAAPPVVAAS